jgi:hypothetical protein
LAVAFLLGLATLVHGQAAGGTKAHSKCDFVPCEKVMLFDDFASDEVGDFPAGWDTNASGTFPRSSRSFDGLASQPFNGSTSRDRWSRGIGAGRF